MKSGHLVPVFVVAHIKTGNIYLHTYTLVQYSKEGRLNSKGCCVDGHCHTVIVT
jgi:hypothetical protein